MMTVMILATVLILPLICIHVTTGECPQMSDIPVMYNSHTFTCMKYWWPDWGDDLSVNACNGECSAVQWSHLICVVMNACTQL